MQVIATACLTQINQNNVKNLQLKWVWRPTTTPADEKMENTPIVVDGVLYATSLTEVVALDAATGAAVLEALASV